MAITLDGTNGITTPALENDGVTTVAAGSASAPAITTDGDTNTGVFFPAADTIAFAEGGAEAMRITSAGRLGLGTTTPGYNQTIFGSGNTFLQISQSGDSVVGSIIGRAGSTNLRIQNSENAATEFWTNNTERMRIDSSGNVLVGTTSLPSGSKSGAGFEAGASSGRTILQLGTTSTAQLALARFYNPNGGVGSIETNGSSTAYNTSSDYRLKENIAPMIGALATVAQLKPCTYTWKVDGSAGQGFIAHELQAVLPDCVSGEKDEVDADGNPQYQGMDTSFLVATLTAAIQELSAKNDALEARIAALEGAQA